MHHIADHEHSTTTTTTTMTATAESSLLHRTSHASGSHIHHHHHDRVHMHNILRQLEMEKHKQQQLKAQAIQYRATAYRRDSHMGHYVSDILAVPAPAAIAEGPVKTSDSLEISMDDLTHKLQGVLSAQSDFRDDRRSSSESASRHSSHNRNQRKQQHHQQQFSEPAPMASATPIFPASRSRSPSPQPASVCRTDSRHSRHSRLSSRAHSPQPHDSPTASTAYYAQNSYSRPHSRPHSRSASPQPFFHSVPMTTSSSPAHRLSSPSHSRSSSRPHSRSPSPHPTPSSPTIYHHSNSGISSRHTSITTSTSRPRTPEEALLQGLLDRIDQHTSERNQDRIRELELENEILRRHRQYRINPDLLVQHRDYGYALPQHHGNANLRHS